MCVFVLCRLLFSSRGVSAHKLTKLVGCLRLDILGILINTNPEAHSVNTSPAFNQYRIEVFQAYDKPSII